MLNGFCLSIEFCTLFVFIGYGNDDILFIFYGEVVCVVNFFVILLGVMVLLREKLVIF